MVMLDGTPSAVGFRLAAPTRLVVFGEVVGPMCSSIARCPSACRRGAKEPPPEGAKKLRGVPRMCTWETGLANTHVMAPLLGRGLPAWRSSTEDSGRSDRPPALAGPGLGRLRVAQCPAQQL